MLKLVPFVLLLTMLGGCFYPSSRPAQRPIVKQNKQQPVAEELPQISAAEQPAELLADDPDASLEVKQAVWDATLISSPELAADTRTLPYLGDFPLSSHERVDHLIKHYSGAGRKTFGRWLERAGRYVPKIQQIFAEQGVPLDLAYLAMVESGFNSKAYSWAHAAGPWQFIESTGKIYDLTNDWWQDQRCHIEKSTLAAAKHLKYLHKRFDGDWYLAVAAYNAGGGKVRKAIKQQNSRNFWDLTEGKVLREETRNYLPKLIATLEIIRDLEKYGFTGLEIDEPLEYDTVTVPTTTDLEIVAKFCETDYAEIKALNPELKRWSTPPKLRDYQLRVPAGTADKFYASYTQLPEDQRARYHRHQIKSGDTLGKLAKKYRIQVDDIISLNNIRNPRALKLGSNLILPLKEGFTRLPVDELADSYVRSRRRTYTVRAGDSLWKIAKRNGVTEKQLRVWNKLGWSDMLRPGQVLAVSKRGAKKVATSSRSRGSSGQLAYKVRGGDSLWTIARKFGVSQQQLRSWNELGRSNLIRPGQLLAVSKTGIERAAELRRSQSPPRKMIYQVQEGDTLWGIGRQFDVATDEIRDWNELSHGHVLRPGQKLTLMVASTRQG